GVVLAGDDRLGQIAADLLGVHVERGHELDVADEVVAELHVHQAGDLLGRVGVPVVLHAFHERGGAVAHADDCHTDPRHGFSLFSLSGRAAACSWRSVSLSSLSHPTSRSTASTSCSWTRSVYSS